MYAVSEEYRKAMHGKVQTFRLTGTAGNRPFTEANILKGSFSVTNQCSGSDAVEIGQVYIGELNATFMNMGIDRYQWQALEICPSLGLKLADGTFEDIPLGVFVVAEAEWTASGIVVKAYDGEGNLWTDALHPDGVIPAAELSFSPTVAVYPDTE